MSKLLLLPCLILKKVEAVRMNIDLKEIITVFSDSNVSELKLELENLKLYLAKSMQVSSPPLQASPAPVEQEVGEQGSAIEVQQREKYGPNVHEVCSPMVGTFYRAPSPDSEPFVTEGSMVEKGQTLCIIEAMKLMNELESEYNGRIVKILVENGQPVEFGQPLF